MFFFFFFFFGANMLVDHANMFPVVRRKLQVSYTRSPRLKISSIFVFRSFLFMFNIIDIIVYDKIGVGRFSDIVVNIDLNVVLDLTKYNIQDISCVFCTKKFCSIFILN